MKLRSAFIFFALLSSISCDRDQTEIEASEDESIIMGTWFPLADGSQAWYSYETISQDDTRGQVIRCWPIKEKLDCLRVASLNNEYISSRFQVGDFQEIDPFLNDWRPRVEYSCTVRGITEPLYEAIGSQKETINMNWPMPGEPFSPWEKGQVVQMLKTAGATTDSYVNCENIALILRKGRLPMLWEGDVQYDDIVS